MAKPESELTDMIVFWRLLKFQKGARLILHTWRVLPSYVYSIQSYNQFLKFEILSQTVFFMADKNCLHDYTGKEYNVLCLHLHRRLWTLLQKRSLPKLIPLRFCRKTIKHIGPY